MLPLQSIGMVVNQAWRPAHYHRPAASTIGVPSPAAILLYQRTMLGTHSHAADFTGTRPATGHGGAAGTGTTAAATSAIAAADGTDDGFAAMDEVARSSVKHTHTIGRHLHALTDGDVVYIEGDGDRHATATPSGDGTPMLEPAWPVRLVAIVASVRFAEPAARAPRTITNRLLRPPRVTTTAARTIVQA